MAKGDKYFGLKKFLSNSGKVQVRLSFTEIERITGYSLPNSARMHAEAWWSNNYDHSQAISWLDAGYETDFVSDTYKDEAIIFIKR